MIPSILARAVAAPLLLVASSGALAQLVQRTATGIVVTPASGTEKIVRLEVYDDSIIRVTAVPSADLSIPASVMVVAQPRPGGFEVEEGEGVVTLSTSKIRATVDLSTGNVSFADSAGRLDLAEAAPGSFMPISVEGRPYFSTRQQWNRGTDEGLFGLGQHQNGQMNFNGEDVELFQHNIAIPVPFVLSTRNYGILWDNNSISRFGNPKPYSRAGDGTSSLTITGVDGQRGWTARYYLGERLAVTRQEPAIDYQYIRDQAKWPAEAKAQSGDSARTQRVVWTGKVTPTTSGTHRFRLYSSSYAKVFVDGEQVLDRWRQNWNPWFHNFDLELTAGRPADVRIEWEPNGGYIALLHSDPLPPAERHSISFASETGRAIDYYYVGGDDLDGVISGYRRLTGKAVLLPKWAYGFWQSRQRYETQDQLVAVVEEYRRRGLPLDNIVQDWFYWPEDRWGCHCFDAARFPNPKQMVERIHDLDARLMISVWPKFYPRTENYRELERIGAVYERQLQSGDKDWVGPGYLSTFYDAFSERGREVYWRQVRDGLGVLGIDAWWMDATEPDMHSNLSLEERAYRMSPTDAGPGAALFNAYPLVHAEGVYEGLLEFRPDVRPFILTRAGFPGLQRTASAVWSGDVASRWDDLREQIAAGVNLSMSGIPNWTHDIGGFSNEARYTNQDPGHLAEWRELNTRWFQFGAFTPLFRSHGEFPRREIYEIAPEGSPAYQSMKSYSELRYRLMPYIYTLAADTYYRDGTIMRGLVMDFPEDRAAWNIADQYMFGPAFLVAPVTEFGARSRPVHLPQGTLWYDLHSGRSFSGGRTIEADAPYEQMPLFVRAGSIVPTGPAIQHTGEGHGGPLTLHVFTGADGRFSLYEDDGVSRDYLKGAWSRIPLRYDEATQTLTIGEREGSYPQMTKSRTFNVRWMTPGGSDRFDVAAPPDETIAYSGKEQRVRLVR